MGKPRTLCPIMPLLRPIVEGELASLLLADTLIIRIDCGLFVDFHAWRLYPST